LGKPQESLDRYLIRRELGRGGMGLVFEVWDPVLEREVALKVMTLEADPEARARFEREARAGARLRHPNIVAIHETGLAADGRPFFVMERIKGCSLDESARDGLGALEAVRIARGIASALQHAHAQGVLHRDLKPANVLIDEDGEPHLVDFGLARVASQQGECLTQDGSILGTPIYMAPEMADGQKADARTDLYGLGAILYYSLTGQPPFESSPSAYAVVKAILLEDPRPPSELVPELPAALDDLVLRLLSKQPDDRPGRAVDALKLLEEVLQEPKREVVPLVAFAGVALVILALLLGLSAPKPGAPKPAAVKPGVVKPAAPKPGVVKPGVVKPGAVKPVAPKPGVVKPAAPKPGVVKPGVVKPGAVKPVAPKPAAPKPVAPKPAVIGRRVGVRRRFNLDLKKRILQEPSFLDGDGDGTLDILLSVEFGGRKSRGVRQGQLVLVSGRSGKLLWRLEEPVGLWFRLPSVSLLKPRPRLFLAYRKGPGTGLSILDSGNGAQLRQAEDRLSGPTFGPVTLPDGLHVVLTSKAAIGLSAYDETLRRVWRINGSELGLGSKAQRPRNVVLFDSDGSGKPELMLWAVDGAVRAYRLGAGVPKPLWKHEGPRGGALPWVMAKPDGRRGFLVAWRRRSKGRRKSIQHDLWLEGLSFTGKRRWLRKEPGMAVLARSIVRFKGGRRCLFVSLSSAMRGRSSKLLGIDLGSGKVLRSRDFGGSIVGLDRLQVGTREFLVIAHDPGRELAFLDGELADYFQARKKFPRSCRLMSVDLDADGREELLIIGRDRGRVIVLEPRLRRR